MSFYFFFLEKNKVARLGNSTAVEYLSVGDFRSWVWNNKIIYKTSTCCTRIFNKQSNIFYFGFSDIFYNPCYILSPRYVAKALLWLPEGGTLLSLSLSLSVPSSLLNQPFHPTLRGLTLTTVVCVHTRDGSDVSLFLSVCKWSICAQEKDKKFRKKRAFHFSFIFFWVGTPSSPPRSSQLQNGDCIHVLII
jgi:hypothetical protein